MPTFNQLVRKGRQTSVKKSTAPALQKTFNSLRKKAVERLHHRNVAFVQQLRLQLGHLSDSGSLLAYDLCIQCAIDKDSFSYFL